MCAIVRGRSRPAIHNGHRAGQCKRSVNGYRRATTNAGRQLLRRRRRRCYLAGRCEQGQLHQSLAGRGGRLRPPVADNDRLRMRAAISNDATTRAGSSPLECALSAGWADKFPQRCCRAPCHRLLSVAVIIITTATIVRRRKRLSRSRRGESSPADNKHRALFAARICICAPIFGTAHLSIGRVARERSSLILTEIFSGQKKGTNRRARYSATSTYTLFSPSLTSS